MRTKTLDAPASRVVELIDYTLILKLDSEITLNGYLAAMDGCAEQLSDSRAVLISFERGGFRRLAAELDRLGPAGAALAIRRQIPVAWVVRDAARQTALHQAWRFATWGLLRGTFVEYAPAWEWLRRESPAVRLAML